MSGLFSLPRVGLDLLLSASASASATVDFTSKIDTAYEDYLITFSNVVPSVDASFWFRVSQAAAFRSGVSDYAWANVGIEASTGVTRDDNDGADSEVTLSGAHNVGAAANEGISGYLWMFSPANTTRWKRFLFATIYEGAGADMEFKTGGGRFDLNTAALDGARFLFSTGNIASGEFKLYGVRKS